jgi:hypothetical protein
METHAATRWQKLAADFLSLIEKFYSIGPRGEASDCDSDKSSGPIDSELLLSQKIERRTLN